MVGRAVGAGELTARPHARMQTMRLFILFVSMFTLVGCVTHQLDYTHHKSNVCEVHKVAMHEKIVTAYHGLMSVDQKTQARLLVADKLFPHAEDSVNPDCDIHGPQSAVVYSCPECERARAQWELSYNAEHYWPHK